MKLVSANGINWPVAEQGDFDTISGGEEFFVIEDECGDQYYAYGHIPRSEVEAEVARYLAHMIPSGDFEVDGWVQHAWAKFLDHDAERFNWAGATAETDHAFPLTVVML